MNSNDNNLNYHHLYPQLKSYLHDHHDLWQNEVLDSVKIPFQETFHYTLKNQETFYQAAAAIYKKQMTTHYQRYLPWAQRMQLMSEDEKVIFTTHLRAPKDCHELNIHLTTIKKLINLPKLTLNTHQHKKRKFVTHKKNHEITQIIHALSHHNLMKNNGFCDFACGVGHLSNAISSHFLKDGVSLEVDPQLIIKGKSLYPHLNYHLIDISRPWWQFADRVHDQNIDLFLSLHCCGELTPKIMDHFCKSKAQNLLSIGCCYFKDPHEYYLDDIKISNDAKTLAARAYRPINKTDIHKRNNVKNYRYLFHLWFALHTHSNDKLTLRSFLPSDYRGDLENYFYKALLRLGRHDLMTLLQQQVKLCPLEKLLSAFKPQISLLQHFGMIRETFARLVEIYLTFQRIDQYFCSSSHNFEVDIFEIFQREISQRNIAVVVKKHL